MRVRYLVLSWLLSLFVISTAGATVWQVGNFPGADFTTLTAAHSGASSGDTLYVHGGNTFTSALTLSKTLIIIGTGYFLDQNDSTQALILPAKLANSITFNAGSEGSHLMGMEVSRVAINTNNITLKRNYIHTSLSGSVIDLNNNDVMIMQNYIVNPHGTGLGIRLASSVSSVLIYNNYIEGGSQAFSAFSSLNTLVEVKHNVLDGDLRVYNAIIENNILISGAYVQNNSITNNNIGDAIQFGTANGNQSNVDMGTVFVGPGTTDDQWQLKVGSPAIGNGVSGVDIGMFGGATPYRLSGLPPIPAIFFLDVPTVVDPATGLSVTIKIKAHN